MTTIEPGVLRTFRIFIWIYFGLTILALLGIGRRAVITPLDIFNGLTALLAGGLALLLSWRWLREQIGERYMLWSLWLVSTVPIMNQYWANTAYLHNVPGGEAELVDGSRLYLWLLLPLFLIAAQYGSRAMLLFTGGTSLMSAILGVALAVQSDFPVDVEIGHALVRLVLFPVLGFIVAQISYGQRQNRAALTQKNEQLAQYATTLEQLAITRERNRLARELHDTLAHTLSAVNVQLKALEVLMKNDPDAAQVKLKQLQAITRESLQSARRALHDLRAQPIEELGLLLALHRLAEQAAQRAGAALRIRLPKEVNGLRPQLEQNLYRIAEEALNNIVRHASARTITVELALRGRSLHLRISDDGVGFDASKPAADGHYGLRGIHERALLIDGTITVESAPGRGTTITLTAPADQQRMAS